MEIPKKIAAVFAALLIMMNTLPVSALDTPAFHAKIEYSFQGYIVKGTFTEFTSDTSSIQPLYSLDGKNYQTCGENWDLHLLGSEEEDILAKLQNQTCLYSNQEPLKSYLAEELDCFYLKLRITRENGITCETQPSVIDRGGPQPIPEGMVPSAMFSPAMSVIERRPFRYYGRYQLTINEHATAEEISAYLPDTLPVKVDLETKKGHFTDGIVDCPVTWKSLSLPRLTAGESVTIEDAVEEIVVPEGTLVTTPTGIYQLEEPLAMDQYAPTDEVRLVLNVISQDAAPTGVLSEENPGLEMSFQLKPTGATAIRAYTFMEGDSQWMELPALPLPEAVNVQPSTQNSGYTLVLDKASEPYRSYRAAQAAGDRPTPFFIGFKIEGGVYNGKQLILAWPDTYEVPVKLPEMGGSGGNQNNAGDGNRDDSTESGQRPDLPHTPENKPQATTTPDDTKNEQQSIPPQDPVPTPKMPVQLNIPGDPFDYITPSGRENQNIHRRETPFKQFPTIEQVRAEIHDKDSSPDPKTTVKVRSSGELTISASPRPETGRSDDLFSSDREEKTDKGDISAPVTENKHSRSFHPVIVIMAVSLCAAGIYFAASPEKIIEGRRMLRRLLLRR